MLGTVAELSQRAGGRTVGDGAVPIARIAAIDEASDDTLTFATSPSYLQAALASKAAAVITDEALAAGETNPGKPLIVVANARAALAALLAAFERPLPRGFRDPSAVIDPTATIGTEVFLGANSVVESGARIGDRAYVGSLAYVGSDAVVGADAVLHAGSKLLHGCEIGDRVMLHPGAVVGSDGFGYVFLEGRFERIPQIGNVMLDNDVEIGANSCVDRAQTGSTRVGEGTKIDNLCQIGHNCRIGKHTGMAAQTGLAGSTILGDYVLVGGQAGFKGHITIGSRVRIAAGTKVWRDVADDAFVSGIPARPHHEDLRREVMVRNLPKLAARVEALEKRRE